MKIKHLTEYKADVTGPNVFSYAIKNARISLPINLLINLEIEKNWFLSERYQDAYLRKIATETIFKRLYKMQDLSTFRQIIR